MSKHALEAYSNCLRGELLMYGIDVVIFAPGAIRTPIWEKIDLSELEPYRDTDYYDPYVKMHDLSRKLGESGLLPEDVSNHLVAIANASSTKTRYNLVRNLSKDWVLPRLMPKRIYDKTVNKMFGFPSISR